ncbi:MAG TPA: hypothetical protein VD741_04540 [Solirubrobacterales bacterium]|nr:hypothetical protein [Solirubrobacterales bacterium]
MGSPERDDGGWGLLLIAFVADVVGILGYLGFSSNQTLRLGVVVSLAVGSLAIGGASLWRSVCLWLSTDGAYYSNRYHKKKIASSGMVFIFAVVLAGAAVDVIVSPESGSKAKESRSGHSRAEGLEQLGQPSMVVFRESL